ncbi:MAG: hypothetical protein HDQ87_01560 [Clostridia bacterium]|nr:hypothetical protein [Clostridia bacterium]
MFKRLLAETLAVVSLVCLVCGSALASPERTAVEVSPFESSQGTICVTADVPGRPQAVWFPAWTQADQSDLVWHPAVLADGRWTAEIALQDHGWQTGLYTVHCYAQSADGSMTLVGGTSAQAEIPAGAVLTVSAAAGGSAHNAILTGAQIPAGSPVTFRLVAADGREAARVTPFAVGTIYAARITDAAAGLDGIYTLQAGIGSTVLASAPVEISGVKGSRLYIENIDGHAGTFQIVADVRSRNAEVIGARAAVWTQPDQSDLQWLNMEPAGDRWVVRANVRDFGRTFGTYTVHVYSQLSSGVEALVDGTQTVIEADSYVYSTVQDDGRYTLNVLGADPALDTVAVEVWSSIYGTDDLARYEMTRIGDTDWQLEVDPAAHPDGRTLAYRVYGGEAMLGSGAVPEPEAYIGNTSLAAEERLQRNAEEVYAKAGTDLHKVYKYVRDSLSYVSRDGHVVPPEGYTRQQWYAVEGLETFHGNCYTFASSFYELAKRLGYDVQYIEGQVPSVSGNWIGHGFVLLTVDGQTYICDPVFEHSSTTGRNYYMQPIEKPRTTYRW